MIWNYIICIIFIAVICYEILLVIRRNRQIQISGSDSLVFSLLVMMAVLLVMPLQENTEYIVMIRNILIIGALLGTFGIKRGISERGIEKVFFTVPWEKITDAEISEYQGTKIQVVFLYGKWRIALIFHKYQIGQISECLSSHLQNVRVHRELEDIIQKKK